VLFDKESVFNLFVALFSNILKTLILVAGNINSLAIVCGLAIL